VAQLGGLTGRDVSELDLHRPYIDEVTFPCPVGPSEDGGTCGSEARRLPPVLDAWFDSGSMPSAQHHFPFGHGSAEPPPVPDAFPADFICEGIDQTRGWFYTLLAVNTLAFGVTPYRNVLCLGLIVDGEGQKMSKSKGNVIDPWHVFDTQGADALRWYFFSSGQPWTARRVFEEGIRESTRSTLLTLWNVYSFFATYADLDGWQAPPPGTARPAPTHVLDRWVEGELDATVAEMTAALDGFDALAAATRLARFVDDLSNWYVRRSRPRFWKSSDPAAHATLHHCLVTAAELLAPFCPFVADELWTTLTPSPAEGAHSVHGADWPAATGTRDDRLAEEMDAARRLVALGRAARTDAKVRVRQPLSRALLLHPGVTLSPDVTDEIATELNVKALEDVDTLSGLISWTVVPNFRALGPRLGSRVNDVKQALAAADGSALQRQLEQDGWVEVAGVRLEAAEVDVRASRHDAFALAEDAGWAVALDLELTDELRLEGTAREIVRGLNDLRKEVGLEIADRIRVVLDGPPAVAAAVGAHRDWIAGEVLARELVVSPVAGDARRISVDDHEVRVSLTKL
jgi:isoleucyl-tRNA synthetase